MVEIGKFLHQIMSLKEANFDRFVFFKYFVALLFVLSFANLTTFADKIDSLRAILPQLEGRDKLRTLQAISYSVQYTDLSEYLDLSREGLEYSRLLGDSLYVAYFLIDVAYYHKYTGKFKEALQELKRAERIARRNHFEKVQSYCYTALGGVYLDVSLYQRALEFHLLSLKIKENSNDIFDLSASLNNIGLVYYKIDDAGRAEEYFTRSLNIKLQQGDTMRCIGTYINLGLTFAERKDGESHKKAINYFKQAITLARRYEVAYRVAFAYNGLATVHENRQKYDSAKHYIALSNSEIEGEKYHDLESSNFFLLGKIAYENGDYQRALDHIAKSLSLISHIKNANREKNIYRLYSDIFEATDKIDSAYYYQKLFIAAKDSIFKDDLAQNIAKIQIATIEEQSRKEIAIREATIARNKLFNLFLLSISVLTTTLIIVIFRNFASISRINKQLLTSKNEIEQQKKDVEKKNAQLAAAQVTIQNQNEVLKAINADLDNKVKERTNALNKSNVELAKAVDDLDQFIYKTSHDLRGPIATLQGVISLGFLDDIDAKSREYFEAMHKVSTNVNTVLTRLIEVHETYQRKPVLEMLDLTMEVVETVEKLEKYAEGQGIEFETVLGAEGPWKSDKHLLNLIIENMVRNAMLYKIRVGARVTIKTEYRNEGLVITVEDNGYGIQPGDEPKVFNIFFKGSPMPGGTGLEIYISKIAVEKLGGHVKLLRPKKNTIFEFTMPMVEN
jgi:signal transduction histidine kinase/tetratricopeptide (TPR) repeat protein